MSGGHFEFSNYTLDSIADSIELVIDNNMIKDSYGQYRGYSEETLTVFRKTVEDLRKLSTVVRRIDYLLSGDDGEVNFHRRLNNDLQHSNR